MPSKPGGAPPADRLVYEPPSTNGTAAPPAVADLPPPAFPTKPADLVRPRLTRWLDLPGEYGEAGYRALVWINYPSGLRDALKGDDSDARKAAITAIVLEHNGWPDDDGNILPPVGDPLFWERCDDYLALSLGPLIRDAPLAGNVYSPPTSGDSASGSPPDGKELARRA